MFAENLEALSLKVSLIYQKLNNCQFIILNNRHNIKNKLLSIVFNE